MAAHEEVWPPLPLDNWEDTCETLHMWMQIAGKVALELTPFLNEWWEVAFRVTARGLTTGLIPSGTRMFEVRFDFIDHNVSIVTSDGAVKSMPLMPRSVADFYREFMAALRTLGIDVTMNTTPAEVPNAVPFDQDTTHASYDAAYANRFWRILVQVAHVLECYRSSFVGKSSPILFYWGSFDLAETRFSGRPGPKIEGPRFYRIAEDQENFAVGFWPGNTSAAGIRFGEPAFYSYAMPAPPGIQKATIKPGAASFDEKLGEFILRYQDARQASDPAQTILDFFQSTYEASATLGKWDRERLERR